MECQQSRNKKVKKEKANFKTVLKLFCFAFYISAVSFGGGFVSISLTRETFVKKLKWVTDKEMTDINSLAQASPGAIAINTTMLTGYKIAGIFGAIFCVIGSIIPPMAIITLFYFFYDAIKEYKFIAMVMKAMQAGVWAVILSLIVDSWCAVIKDKDIFAIILLIFSFLINAVCIFFFSLSVVIYTIILSGALGSIYSLIQSRETKNKEKTNDLS